LNKDQDQRLDLGTWYVGDRYPYPQFRLFKRTWDVATGKFIRSEVDIATEYTAIKFCSRHENNQFDLDDHTKDDIYLDLTTDSGGVAHYEWAADTPTKVGKYIVRLEIERTDGKKQHIRQEFTYHVEHKSSIGGMITTK
jgi:hypothetical protein